MLKALFNLFFPEVCLACDTILGDNEKTICTTCRHDLPVTNFHKNQENYVKKVLYGRAKLVDATALFNFNKKGIVQHLMHQLKYKKQNQLSGFLGDWLGEELITSNLFKTIDIVIPVPLHKSKLKKRGYNQVEGFAKALAFHLEAHYVDNILLKTKATKSQVNKNRLERWQLNNELFTIQNLEQLKGKHILLADDIITTGATIEACCFELNKAENIKISIATMAIA